MSTISVAGQLRSSQVRPLINLGSHSRGATSLRVLEAMAHGSVNLTKLPRNRHSRVMAAFVGTNEALTASRHPSLLRRISGCMINDASNLVICSEDPRCRVPDRFLISSLRVFRVFLVPYFIRIIAFQREPLRHSFRKLSVRFLASGFPFSI